MADENATTSNGTIIGRQELVKRLAEEAKITQKQAADYLAAVLHVIRDALEKGEEVRLVNFGSFKVRLSAARKAVDPRNRQPIQVPAKERVRFSPGKELAEAVLKKLPSES